MIPDSDERRTDDAERPFDPFGADEDVGSSAPVGSLVGAIGQIVTAVLVAVFIGGAVAFRWIVR